jgi:hypothetical protein
MNHSRNGSAALLAGLLGIAFSPGAGHSQLHVDSVQTALESRNIWRGVVQPGATLHSTIDVALYGYPSTTVGSFGVTLNLEGWTQLAHRDLSTSRYTATLAFLQAFAKSVTPNTPILTLGVTGYYLQAAEGDDGSTIEVIGSLSGRVPKWPKERRPRIYLEAARDLDSTKATWVRAGILLDYKTLEIARQSVWFVVDLSGSASDYPCAQRLSCGPVSLHAWRASGRVKWESSETSILGLDGNVRIAVFGGGLWPRKSISPNVGFVGLQLGFVL